MASPASDALHAAVAAALAAGVAVVPPREDGSKAPRTEWKRFQTQAPGRDQVRAWYQGGAAGIGVLTGAVSGGLEMLELEGRAVEAGILEEMLARAEAAGLGELVARIETGYTESTPSGGLHWLYRTERVGGNTKLAADRDGVLIETRGEGGYVITAPSNGRVHPSGGRWTLTAGGWGSLATISEAERGALFDLCRTFDRMPPRLARTPAPVGSDRPGDRYSAAPDAEDRMAELLTAHGWAVVYRRDGVTYLRRPGKADGVSGTIGHHPGLFYVFSTSTEFEAGGHDAFGVYGILEHGGDFKAAASALAALERPVPILGGYAFEEVEAEPTASWPDPPAEAAYHGVLGDIARAIAPHTEADPVGLLGTLLAMFGSSCGGDRSLYQGSLQRANLSVLLVGATGFGGRKGTALDAARAVFRMAYPALDGLWLVGVASGEAISGHLSREVDGRPRYQTEERALLVEPEFGRLLTIMNREGSTLSAVLRNAWDGVPLGHARARDESLVTRHHVSMLGHVTPVELRAKLTDTDAANGFANRLLFLAVRRTRLVPFPTAPDALVRDYARPLHLAIIEARPSAELEFDEDARDRWETFYAELALTPRLGLAGAVTGRHEAQVARLALVYALADRSPVVGVEHLEAAIALADYARRSVLWALGDSTGNRHADALRRMLADGPVTRDQAKRELGLRTAADLDDAVGVLVEAGLAEVVKIRRDGGGRPGRVIRANGANGANGARGARA